MAIVQHVWAQSSPHRGAHSLATAPLEAPYGSEAYGSEAYGCETWQGCRRGEGRAAVSAAAVSAAAVSALANEGGALGSTQWARLGSLGDTASDWCDV